jgi:hypothetical protein
MDVTSAVGSVLAAFGLSGAAGLNAWIPLLATAILGGHRLYALSQGIWDLPVIDENEGEPASANTGTLMRVRRDGSVSAVAGPLDRPTSLELVGHSAYVVTLTGEVMRIDGVLH